MKGLTLRALIRDLLLYDCLDEPVYAIRLSKHGDAPIEPVVAITGSPNGIVIQVYGDE
jgi:hypothetical protein